MSASPSEAPWRVTFADSLAFAQEFDRNLVKRGLFIPTDRMLALRESVDFVLVIPYSQDEVSGRGEVIYVIDAAEAERRGTPSGVGLDLVDFDMEAAIRARRVIGEVLTQAALAPPEQRSSSRIPTSLKVQYQGGIWNEVAVTRDISKGGLFLCTPRQLSTGTPLRVSLVRSARGRDLVLDSEVVRAEMQRLPEPHSEGLGVVFRAMDTESRRRTDRFVHCLDLRRRSLSAQSIRGLVAEAGIENLIKIFGKSGRDGELVVRHGSQAGKIAFQSGRVVRSELPTPGLFGLKAFYQILTWDEGSFDYRACKVSPAPGINQPMDDLLRDGRGFKAQTLEWRRRMPGQSRLVPGPRFDPARICVPVEALPLVEMLPRRPSVSEAVNQLGFTDLEAYRLIENLRSRGLLRLG